MHCTNVQISAKSNILWNKLKMIQQKIPAGFSGGGDFYRVIRRVEETELYQI